MTKPKKCLAATRQNSIHLSNTQNIVAFFDFDETLLKVNSAHIGFKILNKLGLLTTRFKIKIYFIGFLRHFHWISEETMANAMIRFYKGHSLSEFQNNADTFYTDFLKPNLSKVILAKLKWHQQQGHKTALVSGSIRYYLEPVMQDLGIDFLLCTDLETDSNGLLTGNSKGPICVDQHKVVLAQHLVQAQNLVLAESFAYGNHNSDIPLLEMVGNPTAVQPSPKLQEWALKNKCPILFHEN
jgi:HAD superfamily hydrolase (TIGR01490 family)